MGVLMGHVLVLDSKWRWCSSQEMLWFSNTIDRPAQQFQYTMQDVIMGTQFQPLIPKMVGTGSAVDVGCSPFPLIQD